MKINLNILDLTLQILR